MNLLLLLNRFLSYESLPLLLYYFRVPPNRLSCPSTPRRARRPRPPTPSERGWEAARQLNGCGAGREGRRPEGQGKGRGAGPGGGQRERTEKGSRGSGDEAGAGGPDRTRREGSHPTDLLPQRQTLRRGPPTFGHPFTLSANRNCLSNIYPPSSPH